jgi:hypothetical protein
LLRSNPAREGDVVSRFKQNPNTIVMDTPYDLIPTRRPKDFEGKGGKHPTQDII